MKVVNLPPYDRLRLDGDLEDKAAITLREWMNRESPSYLEADAFLSMARAIASCIGELHLHHMVHLDLRPERLLISADNHKVSLQDFGYAIQRTPDGYLRPPGQTIAEASWPYCSPENTGRMLRAVDERSDLYSLGVMFYEMLTGQLPFVADNALEWVYLHLAQSPPPMNDAAPSWSAHLESIVFKLLEKNPDKRYPSIDFLIADLDKIGRAHETFSLEQHFNGREHELVTLTQAFHAACLGSTEIVYVSGEAGIGKSSIINEMFRRHLQNGEFHCITGKFEQLPQESPYYPIIQAIRGFMRHLLGERIDKVAQWERKLRNALGPNAAIMAEIIPEVGLLLGNMPEVEQLQVNESQKRFTYVFRKFIQALAGKEHPLILFVDDLQWANASSLQLIHALLSDPECQYLMFIGTYRHTEMDSSKLPGYEPGGRATDQAVVRHIHLEPLNQAHMNRIVMETLNCPADDALALTELLYHATDGNPFHFKQVLLRLQDDNVLQYCQGQRRWQWDLGRIIEQLPSYAILDLMGRKLQRLPHRALGLLRIAACVGSTFLPKFIFEAARMEGEPTEEWAAVEAEGLIVRLDADTYRFAHDHIQKLIYSGIGEDDQQKIHIQIGTCLSGAEIGDRTFDRVNHLNRGSRLITDERKVLELASLNLEAGRRAKSSSAYDVALSYFAKGIELLSPTDWNEHFELRFELHAERAECEYLCGNYAVSEQEIDKLLLRARNPIERSRVQLIRITQYINQGKYLESTALGLESLKEHHVWLSPAPGKPTLLMEGLRIESLLRNRFDKLAAIEEMTDPSRIAAMNLIHAIIPSTFFTDKKVFFLLVCRAVHLTLKYGKAPASAAMYSAFGMLLGTARGKPDKGYAISKVGLELADGYDSASIKSRTYTMFGAVLCQFAGNAGEVDYYLTQALKHGMNSGDYVFASYAMGGHVNSLYTRATLIELARTIAEYMAVLDTTNDEFVRQNFHLYQQIILALQGKTDAPDSFSGGGFDEARFLDLIRKEETSATTMYQYITYKTQLCFLLGKYEDAIGWADQAAGFEAYATHLPHWPECVFYETLASFACYNRSQRQSKRNMRKIRLFQKWATWSPMNYQSRYDLLQAELHRASGNDRTAEEMYDKALREAREQGDCHVTGIAGELAAIHYWRIGKNKTAVHYLQLSIEGYREWGVMIKVTPLEQLLWQWLGKEEADSTSADGRPSIVISHEDRKLQANNAQEASQSADNLDLKAVLKATQAMTTQLDIDTVLVEIMSTLMKAAGASKGALLTASNDHLLVQAYSDAERQAAASPWPLSDSALLPEGIIRYVFRTREEILYNDGEESWLIHNPYIAKHRPQSALCMPVTVHGSTLGVLYLENKLAKGIFAPDRTAVLLAMASHGIFMCLLQNSHEPAPSELADEEEASVPDGMMEEPLTERELEVLALLSAGLSNKEIADRLIIAIGTVKVHVKNIFAKLKVNRRTKAVAQAKQLKLLEGNQ
ncbi:AAA family ATPase [Paenibacillus sp. PR3]|uniref:AAA family ATPase n=1 Tax=Paenibacillus terricola TaxID=2763503 RepID=A0ABR8MWP8_9BACL|nr:AAA family ATPase [Paenibacillus terricola]MBD3920383.1 AAA family ATPase [Paenibacillus terricola]